MEQRRIRIMVDDDIIGEAWLTDNQVYIPSRPYQSPDGKVFVMVGQIRVDGEPFTHGSRHG